MLDINIKNPVFLPVENFCIRKPSGIFSEGKYWIYADVVPWKHSYWPNTYDTSIHAGISSEIDSSGHFNLKIFASSFKITPPFGV